MIAAGSAAAVLGLCATLSIACAAPASADAASMTFASSGVEQVFAVPAGVSTVHVVAIGAPGASGTRSGGFGGRVIGDLPVVGGQTLFVEVGGKGNRRTESPAGAGGFNGGASGGQGGGVGRVAGGGGASDVRTVSASQSGSLGSRLIVAGGGGGSGDSYGLNSGGDAGSSGGNGSNTQNGSSGGGGGGGAGTVGGPGAGGSGAGGAAGAAGTLGVGGTGGNSTGFGGGGGGGGRYGGGGGGGSDPNGSGGGGGGSSFTDPVVGNASTATDATGVPSIAISYQDPGGTPLPRPTATTVSCTYSAVGFSDSCSATVRDAGGAPQSTPTGQVNFSTGRGGTFSAGNACALSPLSLGVASCSVKYVPPATGSPSITGSYVGDTLHNPSSGATSFLLATFGNARVVSGLVVPNLIAAPSGPSVSRVTFGATVRFALRAPASVRFTVQKPANGRLVRTTCKAPNRSNRSNRKCARWVTLRGSFTRIAPKGNNKFRFRGRLGGKTLAPGRYRLVATPAVGGATGKPTSATFKVKRR
jgi:hypothetical protein